MPDKYKDIIFIYQENCTSYSISCIIIAGLMFIRLRNSIRNMRIEDLTGQLPKPVYYPSPAERERYTRELIEGGTVRVHLEHRFNSDTIQGLITQAIAVNVWALPSRELGNQLPLQASSAHKARP